MEVAHSGDADDRRGTRLLAEGHETHNLRDQMCNSRPTQWLSRILDPLRPHCDRCRAKPQEGSQPDLRMMGCGPPRSGIRLPPRSDSLLAVNREGEEDIPRRTTCCGIAGVEDDQAAANRRPGAIDRSAAALEYVHGVVGAEAVEVPDDRSVPGRIGAHVAVN